VHGTRDRPFERRQDPELAPPFAKDPEEERFLERLNEVLAPHAEGDLLELEERYPTLHVVGAPRSGTTLLYQLVASGLEVGYVNHLVAATWRAPVYGLRLSRKLGLDRPGSSFQSSFGRTSDVREPHEFGYFWNERLRYPDLCERPPAHESEVDWAGLRRVLVNMAHAAGAPVAFKPMLLLWHLETILEHMPRTCYVWIRRDLRANALSLLEMRRALFGSYERWASLRPCGPGWLADEPPWRQVAAQAVALDRTLETARGRLGDRMLEVEYERLCAAPEAVLDDVRALLGDHGFAPERRQLGVNRFDSRRESPLEAEFGARVDDALAQYTASAGIP